MIRPRYLPDSIVVQLVSVSAFSHSLDPFLTFLETETHLNDWGQDSSYLVTDSETEGR